MFTYYIIYIVRYHIMSYVIYVQLHIGYYVQDGTKLVEDQTHGFICFNVYKQKKTKFNQTLLPLEEETIYISIYYYYFYFLKQKANKPVANIENQERKCAFGKIYSRCHRVVIFVYLKHTRGHLLVANLILIFPENQSGGLGFP